jgi:hypothetical protein
MRSRFGGQGISRVSGGAVLALSLLAVGRAPTSAEGPCPPKSPKEVVRSYRKMDARGERLTTGGWYRAFRFFVKPEPVPEHRFIAVMDGEADPYIGSQGNDKAEIRVPCSAVGQIDFLGRFTFLVAPSLIDLDRHLGQPGTPQMRMHGPHAPLNRIYDLVLTSTHWELGPGTEGLREVKGTPEWRIETFEREPWVTLDVAIEYLTEMRDRSKSLVIKRNAEKSILMLRPLLREAERPQPVTERNTEAGKTDSH